MKREDQIVIRYKRDIKSGRQFNVCAVRSAARGRRSKKVREASDVNNACISSIVGDELPVSFAASNLMHSVQPIMPNC